MILERETKKEIRQPVQVKVSVVKEQRITWTGQVSCGEKGESSLNRFNVISSIYDKKEETPRCCKYVKKKLVNI